MPITGCREHHERVNGGSPAAQPATAGAGMATERQRRRLLFNHLPASPGGTGWSGNARELPALGETRECAGPEGRPGPRVGAAEPPPPRAARWRRSTGFGAARGPGGRDGAALGGRNGRPRPRSLSGSAAPARAGASARTGAARWYSAVLLPNLNGQRKRTEEPRGKAHPDTGACGCGLQPGEQARLS